MKCDYNCISWALKIIVETIQEASFYIFQVQIFLHHFVSSIVNWGYQDNFKPVYFFIFFYKKNLHLQKHSQANINQLKQK